MNISLAAVLCGVSMWACGDQQRAEVPTSLVAAVAEPPGANCVAGGEAIEIGADTNGNGVLDVSEITATSYVCSAVSGSAGSAALVVVVAEPAGAHCVNGGQAIETGVDANGNGVLDPSEVSQTSYICAGANGAEPLIRIDAEPAGAHCSTGGSAIHVGIDSNGDNILEDSEIDTTTYMCRPANTTVIDGGFTVNNSVDAAQLVGVTTITGDLTISATGLTAIDLSSLQTVGGTVTYTGFSGSVLSMPALTSAKAIVINSTSTTAPLDVPVLSTVGAITLSQCGMTTQTFPAMANIDTTLNVWGCATLTTLSFPVLATVHNLTISGCPAITSLDFSLVTTAQQVSLSGDTNLTSLSLPLTSVTSLTIGGNAALTTVDLSSLATVSQNFVFYGLTALTSLDVSSLTSIGSTLEIENSAALTEVSFPVLTSVGGAMNGWVVISYNPILASISAPLWTTDAAAGFELYSNPTLPTCQIQALADQMNAQNRYINGNDNTATCP